VANHVVLDKDKRLFLENSLRFKSGRTRFHFWMHGARRVSSIYLTPSPW